MNKIISRIFQLPNQQKNKYYFLLGTIIGHLDNIENYDLKGENKYNIWKICLIKQGKSLVEINAKSRFTCLKLLAEWMILMYPNMKHQSITTEIHQEENTYQARIMDHGQLLEYINTRKDQFWSTLIKHSLDKVAYQQEYDLLDSKNEVELNQTMIAKELFPNLFNQLPQNRCFIKKVANDNFIAAYLKYDAENCILMQSDTFLGILEELEFTLSNNQERNRKSE